MSSDTNVLTLRLAVVDPPEGVRFAVQRGRHDLLEPLQASRNAITFEFTVRAVFGGEPPLRFLGDYTQGPVSARFVYVCSGTLAGHAGSVWTRRAKVPIFNIPRDLVEAAVQQAARLEASIAGTARDGGPCCAGVKLLSGWTLGA